MPFHGGSNSKYAKSLRPQQEGDEVGVLFSLVLEKLLISNNCGNKTRMPKIPKGADPQDFHRTCWKQFTRNADKSAFDWSSMSHARKYQHMHTWLFKKFTLDPKHKCMTPGPWEDWKKRNDACWTDFWMTDQELHHLVREVLEEASNVAS